MVKPKEFPQLQTSLDSKSVDQVLIQNSTMQFFQMKEVKRLKKLTETMVKKNLVSRVAKFHVQNYSVLP